MPIHHAVLALLVDGPSHGYQLRAAFEEAVGPQWGGLNIGHLYQVMERLTRDGYVSSAHVAQTSRPDRRVYQLTPAGRDELDSWLAEPVERTQGQRDDLILKLMAAARRGEEELLGVLRRQRTYELIRLKSLDQLGRDQRESPLAALLLYAAVLQTRAHLELLDRAEQRSTDLSQTVVRSTPVAIGEDSGFERSAYTA